MKIVVERIVACNDKELQEKLNELNSPNIISVKDDGDVFYQVIYEAYDPIQ